MQIRTSSSDIKEGRALSASLAGKKSVEVCHNVALVMCVQLLRHSAPMLVDGRHRAPTEIGDLLVVLSFEIQRQHDELLTADPSVSRIGRDHGFQVRAPR